MARTTMDSGSQLQDSPQNVVTLQADGTDRIELPSGDFIADAKMTKDGDDLVLQTADGSTVVVEGYFSADPAPLLISDDGAALTPNLVEAFVRSPMEFAANDAANDESPVGAVEEVKGNATVTRADGSVETITAGTPIYQGDVIETDAEGAVNIVFMDETSMAISHNARMAVDEYTFDPASESGTTNLSVLRGLFVFTSGLIGRDDPDDVAIDTPVGSIGIRGTIIAGEINPGGESNISVLEGAIVVKNGTMEATLSQQFETIRLGGFDQPMKEMGVVPASDINTKFQNIETVLPSLFSVINEAVQEQSQQPQQNQTPQNNAPSEPEAKAEPAPTAEQPVTQEVAPPAPTPAPTQDIVSLNNNSGLPSNQIVMGQTPSGTDAAYSAAGNAPAAGLAPVISTMPGPAGVAPTVQTNISVPSVLQPTTNIPTTPAAPTSPPAASPFAVTVSMAVLTDIAQTGDLVGTINYANAPAGATISYTFANGTTFSENGYFELFSPGGGVTQVILTSAGHEYLVQTPDLRQLGGFSIKANVDGTLHNFNFSTNVSDANGPLFNVMSPTAEGITRIADGINNYAGYSISALGDTNHDGFDEFIFGNHTGIVAQNHVYIVNGRTAELGNADGTPDGNINIATLTGLGLQTVANPSGPVLTYLDTVVTGIGDFDGDGYEDYAVGQSNAQVNGISSGNAFIISGANPSNSIEFSAGSGAVVGDNIGSSISAIGDYNNDGRADVIIGASGSENAYLVAGRNGWTADITSTSSNTTYVQVLSGMPGTGFGASVKGIGDFNGDGFSDFAVGNPGQNSGDGAVNIFFGKNGTLSAPTIYAGIPGQGLGSEILSLGDINGDGYSDIMVAGDGNQGRIIMGNNAGASDYDLAGPSGYDITGGGGVGDFNGDGLDDFAISVADSSQTKLYVVYGKDGVVPDLSFEYLKNPDNAFEMIYNGANSTDDMLEISTVGDINGDGYDDFGIGVPNLNGAAVGDGGIILVYGRDTGNVTPGLTATDINNSLVGTTGVDIMNDAGRNGTSFRGGADEDTIIVSNNAFKSIDGGGGYDTIKMAGTNLDFSNINFETISGIERLQFGAVNSTMTLTLENIFNLLKTSDGFLDGTPRSSVLKIHANGFTGAQLNLITDTDGLDDFGGTANTTADIVTAIAGYNSSTVTPSSGGGFNSFQIGGYTLMIDQAITVDVQ